MNPRERIGAGAPESGFGYDALKAHPFFAGVNLWDSKHNNSAPIPQEAFSRYQVELKAHQDRLSSSNMQSTGAQEEQKGQGRMTPAFLG